MRIVDNRNLLATAFAAALVAAVQFPTPSAAQPEGQTPPTAKPRAGDEPSDEKQLRELELGVERTAGRPAAGPLAPTSAAGRFLQSLNPDIGAILTVTGAYFNDRGLGTNGNAVPEGESDPQRSGIGLQELEIAIQAAVDPYFRIDTFLSISLEGLEIEESYFSTLALPGSLQIRGGLMNQKFGRHNLLHLHNWMFVDNMLPVARLLGKDALRALSFETSWLMPLPWFAELSLSVSSPTGANVRSFIGEGPREEGFHIGDPGDLLYVFRLGQHVDLATDWGLSFGLSYALAPNHSGRDASNRTHLFGGDLFLKWRPLRVPYTEIRFTTEGYARLAGTPEGRLFDWGLYAMLTFRLGRRWHVSLRYDMVEIDDASKLVTHAFVEPSTDPDQPIPIDDQNRGSVALTWRPTEFSQIRLQYNNSWIRRTTDQGLPGGYGQVHEVFLQFQGSIGTHGAHPW